MHEMGGNAGAVCATLSSALVLSTLQTASVQAYSMCGGWVCTLNAAVCACLGVHTECNAVRCAQPCTFMLNAAGCAQLCMHADCSQTCTAACTH